MKLIFVVRALAFSIAACCSSSPHSDWKPMACKIFSWEPIFDPISSMRIERSRVIEKWANDLRFGQSENSQMESFDLGHDSGILRSVYSRPNSPPQVSDWKLRSLI